MVPSAREGSEASEARRALDRARGLSDEGNYVEALHELDNLLDVDAANAEALAAKGWALENLGPEHLPDARHAYASAQALQPEDLRARAGLANVVRRLGDHAEAVRMFERIDAAAEARMSAEPDLIELVGWCRYRLGRYEDAASVFEAALAVDEDWVSVRFDLALTLLCLGRHDEASVSYTDGLARARGRRDRRSLVHVALDDLREAIAERPPMADSQAVQRIREALTSEID